MTEDSTTRFLMQLDGSAPIEVRVLPRAGAHAVVRCEYHARSRLAVLHVSAGASAEAIEEAIRREIAALEARLADPPRHEVKSVLLADVDLADVDLTGADAANTGFFRVGFAGTRARGMRFIDARLTDCDLRGCDLTDAWFAGAVANGCSFRGARLGVSAGAGRDATGRFRGARFIHCDFRGAELDGAELERAELLGCWRDAGGTP